MQSYNLNNRTFVVTDNKNGLSSSETRFYYKQNGDLITASYKGGQIREGSILGRQVSGDKIELLYHCITIHNELKAGKSNGRITEDSNGKLKLTFEWNWLNGDLSGGMSYYQEIE